MEQRACDLLGRVRALYHFTDQENIPSIQAYGLLSLAELESRGIRPKHLSDQTSRDSDKLAGTYCDVHLCLHSSHHMAWAAQQQGRGDLVFLKIDPIVLTWPCVRFCNIMANTTGANIISIESAAQELPYELLNMEPDWGNDEYKDRMQIVKRHEILVPHPIPLQFIEIPLWLSAQFSPPQQAA